MRIADQVWMAGLLAACWWTAVLRRRRSRGARPRAGRRPRRAAAVPGGHHEGGGRGAQDRRCSSGLAARDHDERQDSRPHDGGGLGDRRRTRCAIEVAVRKDTSEWDTFRKEMTDSAGSPIAGQRVGRDDRPQRHGQIRGGVQAAGRHGADARQECDQPAAGAARPGTAADPATGEVRRSGSRRPLADRLQSVQHQRQGDGRAHHAAVQPAALQPVAGAGRTVQQQHGEFLRPA